MIDVVWQPKMNEHFALKSYICAQKLLRRLLHPKVRLMLYTVYGIMVHDRTSKLHQSIHIPHQAETQETVRQGEEFLWSVYQWLICLPSWITEAEHCSALSLPQRCRQTTKQTNLSYLGVSNLRSRLKPSRQLYGHPGEPSQDYRHRCLLGSPSLGVAGRQRGRWMAWAVARSGSYSGTEAGLSLSRPVMARHCEVWEHAVRQGSAGTFGICSYQQERSALQSLQGEGGEREREWSWSGSREAWRTGKLAWWIKSECFNLTGCRKYIQYPPYEVLSVLKH